MYDLKIPLGMMSEILIVRNRLKKDVEKEHITQNQAERFLAEYMLRELHVISGKEAADKQVLSFIDDFREDDKSIRQKFCAGYCYYFAVMLKDAFHRGEICWCAPLGHICWVDDNGVPYDIDGVCDSDCNFLSQSDTSAKALRISVMYRAGDLMPQKNTLRLQSKRSAGTLLQILKTKEKNYDLKSKIQIQQTYRHK